MKCNPLRWLWGLLPVLLLGWAAAKFSHADIEADLKKRVDAQLTGSGFKWSQTGFSGRDGRIAGVASDEADPGRAYDIARSIWGVRVVDNQATMIEKAETYQWSATRAGNSVRLAGHVPNDGVRSEIMKQARAAFPGHDVADEMKLARGVPSDAWISGVTFGMKQLAGLKSGEARLTGLSLAVSGEAGDHNAYRSVKAALANELPKGLKLTDDRVTAPRVKPFVWAAKNAAGQLLLSGYVPSERARSEILAAARAAFPKAQVVDKMDVADGAAASHVAAATTGLKELARLEEGSAEIAETNLAVKGVATDTETADAVRQSLGRDPPQGFRISDAITARVTGPRPVSPYTTAATVDTALVILNGFAPSDAAREQAAGLARQRFPNHRVDNRLVVAPGAPDGWQRCLDAAFAGAARLGNGKIALTDRRLDMSGTTDDENLAGAIPAEVKGAAKTDCDTNVRVDLLAEAVPELVWRATLSGNELVLDGDVSSAAAKSNLVAAAQRQFQGRTVVDRMRIVETRSRKWPAAAEQGLIALSTLKKGTATLVRQELTVSGEAADAGVITRVREQFGRDLAKDYTGRDQITVAAAAPPPPPAPPAATPPPPPVPAPAAKLDQVQQACQVSLQQTAREGMIRFERASATLTRDSFPTLDKLVAAVKNCPKIGIEIEGHTDAEGTPERNQRLSDRRAQAVVEYLSRSGVESNRLSSVGYGESRPLAPNDTVVNRAKNRRIEFTVKAL